MPTRSLDLAQVRLDNAMVLFEEFVRATARHADAATLRGLERRFAERLQIQPSYWSQIKGRSRQIGERLARQFEQLCHKPVGWMDQPHDGAAARPGPTPSPAAARTGGDPSRAAGAALRAGDPPHADDAGPRSRDDASHPRDDDERFIVGLVLSYYRRHPQRARTRLLDLLGEVLTPGASAAAPGPAAGPPAPGAAGRGATRSAAPAAAAEDPHALWQRTQTGVAPLKRRR